MTGNHAEGFECIHGALMISAPAHKAAAVNDLAARWQQGLLHLDHNSTVVAIGTPGRPLHPRLVPAKRLPRRSVHMHEGRAALVHAIAHIEFNAINLALDAAYRFRHLPDAYYGDWLGVAVDEARHFGLLQQRLNALGHAYGDFDAHNGLWEMAEKTADDAVARMALVPRVLEARGLDVTPGMMERLSAVGDKETVAVLEVILREEVAHVEIGTRWFRYLCAERDLQPEDTFFRLLAHHMRGGIKGPLNERARREAGFSDAELARLGDQQDR